MRKFFLPLALAAIPAAALADAHTDGPAISGSIAAPIDATLVTAGERWRSLYEARDWEALAALYAEDAVLMANGSDKVEGRDAIIAFLRRLSDAGGGATMRFEPEEAVVESGLGIVTARYWMNIELPGGAKRNIAGRSLLIYKRVGENWLLWRDMDNYAPAITADPVPEQP